jgi:hypothetical protein
MLTVRSATALALGFVLAIYTAPGLSQNYPDRPIKIVDGGKVVSELFA